MFPRTYVTLICLASIALCLQSAPKGKADDRLPAPDLTSFPKLSGKMTQLLGHEQGYIRPKPGAPFHLELADLPKINKLEFDAARGSYIPLPGPVEVEAVRYYPNGAFSNMRLVSSQKEGHRVAIDIVPKPGQGPNRVLVWVVIENNDVVQGVALIECEADGKFPKRRR